MTISVSSVRKITITMNHHATLHVLLDTNLTQSLRLGASKQKKQLYSFI